MKKCNSYFILLLFLLSPSVLHSGYLDNPIAAQINKKEASIHFIFIDNANEEIQNTLSNDKTTFYRFLYKNPFCFGWFTRKINSKSTQLKTETNKILAEGIDSFKGGFVPHTFLKSITVSAYLDNLFHLTGHSPNKLL